VRVGGARAGCGCVCCVCCVCCWHGQAGSWGTLGVLLPVQRTGQAMHGTHRLVQRAVPLQPASQTHTHTHTHAHAHTRTHTHTHTRTCGEGHARAARRLQHGQPRGGRLVGAVCGIMGAPRRCQVGRGALEHQALAARHSLQPDVVRGGRRAGGGEAGGGGGARPAGAGLGLTAP
jgi:hypothetical protein